MNKLMMVGLLVAAGMAAVPAQAQDMANWKGPDAAVATLQEGVYVLDNTHTSVVFRVWHMGLSHFAGTFNKISGTANVNVGDLNKSSVSVVIDPKSVDTNVAKLDEELAGGKFFEAAKYPGITFKSTKVELTSAKGATPATGKLYGDLTLHGVTKPVVLDVTFNGHLKSPMGGGERIGFSATGMLKRSDFGISMGIPIVGDEVEFTIVSEFSKAV